ncbi:MAG: hypothetical protein KDJ17_09935, partial [Hyphomicrobiaceae bacterium]|nr:hypothetical protein [Hyphomicrobiaceae bacterium]
PPGGGGPRFSGPRGPSHSFRPGPGGKGPGGKPYGGKWSGKGGPYKGGHYRGKYPYRYYGYGYALPYYYMDNYYYGGSCAWLWRKWLQTGNPKWKYRYYDCID